MTTSAPPPNRRTILRNTLDAALDELDAAVTAGLVAATTTPPEATPHTEEHPPTAHPHSTPTQERT